MRPWLYSDIMMQVNNSCYKKKRKYFLECPACNLTNPAALCARPSLLRKEGEEKRKKNLSLRSREGAGGELTNKEDIYPPLLQGIFLPN